MNREGDSRQSASEALERSTGMNILVSIILGGRGRLTLGWGLLIQGALGWSEHGAGAKLRPLIMLVAWALWDRPSSSPRFVPKPPLNQDCAGTEATAAYTTKRSLKSSIPAIAARGMMSPIALRTTAAGMVSAVRRNRCLYSATVSFFGAFRVIWVVCVCAPTYAHGRSSVQGL